LVCSAIASCRAGYSRLAAAPGPRLKVSAGVRMGRKAWCYPAPHVDSRVHPCPCASRCLVFVPGWGRGTHAVRHIASASHLAFTPLTLAYGATPLDAPDWLRDAFSHREVTWMYRASHDGDRASLSTLSRVLSPMLLLPSKAAAVWFGGCLHLIVRWR